MGKLDSLVNFKKVLVEGGSELCKGSVRGFSMRNRNRNPIITRGFSLFLKLGGGGYLMLDFWVEA